MLSSKRFYAYKEDVSYLPKDLFGDKNPIKMNIKKILKRQESRYRRKELKFTGLKPFTKKLRVLDSF